MKTSVIFIFIFGCCFSFAQSEGPFRSSSATGHLVKPAQVQFSEKNLAKLKTTGKYKVQVFAKDLKDPRMMVVDGDGAVYVSRPKSGDILVLRDTDNDGQADSRETFASGYAGAHGMAIFEKKLYFVALQNVYFTDLKKQIKDKDKEKDKDKAKNLIVGLPGVGQHENRSLAIGPDGRLYVSIASNCNSCVDPDKKMATMRRFGLDGRSEETFASGLRDTIGFDWDTEKGNLWGMDHGTDWRGDKIPPEELNLIKAGFDYGWPFCWGEKKPEQNLIDNPEGKTREAYCEKTEAPKLTYDAHAAPMALKFYKGEMFPELKGHALVAFHGSWNRSKPVGYKVAKILFKGGEPQKFEDFFTGFLSADGKSQIGRPVGLAFMSDGSILVSDDSGGVIYRISK